MRDKGLFIAKIVVVSFALVFFVFPLYWMFTMAFKPEYDWASYPVKMFPNPWTLDNLITGLFRMNGLKGIFDSTIIATCNAILSLLLGSFSGYFFSRYRRGQRAASFILSQRIAPAIAFALPFFTLFNILNLLDTHLAVIIAHLTFNIPFATWIMKNFFDNIPKDLDDSALVDGCSPLGALIKVILPASLPGVIATFVMLFMFSWNEFLIALFLTKSAVTPLPTLIPKFYGGHDILYGVVCAVALFASIPPIIMVALFQKYLVSGMTMGYVKG